MAAPRVERPGFYYPRMSATWWLRRPGYVRFMIREISSVFIAIFLVVLLCQVYRASQGPEAWSAHLAALRSPGWIVFHLVALAFAIYHSVTWFQATGVVQVVRLGERQLPPALVVGGAFAAWVVASVAILAFFVRYGA